MPKLMIDDCCLNCTNREIGCHAKCNRYITAKQEYMSKVKERYEFKQAEKEVEDTLFQGTLRKKGLKR